MKDGVQVGETYDGTSPLATRKDGTKLVFSAVVGKKTSRVEVPW
jgi:hypothetical protein